MTITETTDYPFDEAIELDLCAPRPVRFPLLPRVPRWCEDASVQINGHTVAAGCMLALACDRRFMADVAAKVSLNEITFGAAVFGGSVEMLRACVGHRQAERVLEGGAMYGP